MFKSLLRDRLFLLLLLLVIAIRLFSLNELRVEKYYATGFYPFFSRILRVLTGWIPFSLGDLLYIAAFLFLVIKAWKLIKLLARRRVKEYLSWILFRKYIRLVLWIYIVFNISWGLNYNRVGIAGQLGLQVQNYSKQEILQLTGLLLNKLNLYAAQIDTVDRAEVERPANLFKAGVADFAQAERLYPFLQYSQPSLKVSIYSYLGHYFGFTGYINPFTAEAQLNINEPMFIKPFVLNHEIAHQVGYGKENEASFVSFLACKESANLHTKYSVYYEMFLSAFRESLVADSSLAKIFREKLHLRVTRDRAFELNWRRQRKNNVQPLVTDFYDNYLRLNNQPKGMATYNEVIAWLIAYMKKYGAAAI